MNGAFPNRIHAGRMLASWLRSYAGQLNVLVLALPRGGVPVAAELAQKLSLPLDVMCVRKIGVPGHEELAMGAIASGGVTVRNPSVIESFCISDADFARVAKRENAELDRREQRYRRGRPPLDLHGKHVVLVDDGIATGSTMLAAIRAARALEAKSVIVATPVVAREALEELRQQADEVFTVLAPETLFAIGEFYDDFSQTTDDEVIRLLAPGREPALNHPGGPP